MSFERISEEKIRQAMAAGDFNDLKGKGQPLHLDPENPYQAEEDRLAHHLLQQNGFSLPWIEVSREIDADLEAARAWLRNQHNLAASDQDWRAAQAEFARKLDGLNKRIRDFNLQVPAAAFQRRLLKVDQEMKKAIRE